MVKKRFWKKRSSRAASDLLEDAVRDHQHDTISVGELITAMHERGFGLLLIIFVLPNCVPIPVPPGISTLLSVPLLFLSVQMIIGKDSPWMPARLKRYSLKRQTIANTIAFAGPKLKKIEKLLQPRLSFASTQAGEKIIGVMCLFFSLSIAVPLPLTNFLPGVGILVMSLGLLSKDGIVILIGCVTGWLGVAFTAAVLWLGAATAYNLLESFI